MIDRRLKLPVFDTRPTMQHGNPARLHTEGDIAALKFATQSEQYSYGARWLRALLGTPWRARVTEAERGLAMSDMAVLVRTRKQLLPVATALRAAGLSVLAKGEQSLLVPDEAEAIATALDFMAGRRIDPPIRGGKPSIVSKVSASDVRRKVLLAGLAQNDTDAERGIAFLTKQMQPEAWHQEAKCLIEVIEDFLCSLGYHAAFDGESPLYPALASTLRDGQTRNGELAWYAIRRVLNAAADYERFHFRKPLGQKIIGFSEWLRLEAPLVYKGDEHAEDNGLRVNPDAINLMTAHSAKGLEWPIVWIPDLTLGTFPSWQRKDGSAIWKILPHNALTAEQKTRADGELADEDRLAYVTMTRFSQYLLATCAERDEKRRLHPSPYWKTLKENERVVTDRRYPAQAARSGARKLPPSPKRETKTICVTFSQLFLYWVCPRSFYLRFLLGFPPPTAQELGYGQSLHNAAKEIHQRVRNGEHFEEADIAAIAERHFYLPYADRDLTKNLRRAAVRALTAYHAGYRVENDGTMKYIEQEVRCDLGSITLMGRIDLARVLDNGEVVLSELKTEDAVSKSDELFAYGLGFEATHGRLPDWVETRPIRADITDNRTPAEHKPVRMDEDKAEQTRKRIRETGADMARGHFPMLQTHRDPICKKCDVRRICPKWQAEWMPRSAS